MALFRRDKVDTTTGPEELQTYYQAERRERGWMALVLAFLTMAATVLIILGLFYGGRWTYRKIRNQDTPATVSVQEENQDSPGESAPPTPASESTPDGSDSPNPSATPSQGAQSPENNPSVPTPATPNPPRATTTPQTSSTNTTNTSGLPSSGPSDTLAVFLAVSAFAYLIHRRFLASK